MIAGVSRNQARWRRCRGVLVAGAAALACCMCGDGQPQRDAVSAGEPRPSFVVILLDDLDLELGSLAVMPRARRLVANQRLELMEYFVSTPLCCPSRTTLLTGQYTHNHRVYRNRGQLGGFRRFQQLNLEQKTLALALQRAGYRTALIGKYLNEYGGVYVPPGWNEWVAAGTDAYNGFGYDLSVNGKTLRYGNQDSDYATDVFAGYAESFLATQDPGAPFFLFFAPLAPHPPATPARRHAGMFGDLAIARTPAFNELDVSDKPPDLRDRAPLTAAQVQELDEHYRQRLRAVQAVDEAVERLDAVLRRRGLSEHTYVIFTSDNGFHTGQHRLAFGKGTAYEEDIHVPLFVRGPRVRVGAKDSRLSTSVDLPATIADLAGVPLPEADGRSLRPLWESGRSVPWRQFVLVENFTAGDGEGSGDDQDAVPAAVPLVSGLRSARHKYVELGGGRWFEFYSLDEDPHELENSFGCIAVPEQRQLADLLREMASCSGEACRRLEGGSFPRVAVKKPCSS